MSAINKPKKVFLLGVGAQKSGTTWLFNELSKCRETDMGFLKEYKALRNDVQGFREWLKRRRKDKKELSNIRVDGLGLCVENFDSLDKCVKQKLMMIKPSIYLDYFAGLVSEKDGIYATGDISPHYSTLNSATLKRIRLQLMSRGFHVKTIFLMRDPVERVWSQIRMIRRNQSIQEICQCHCEEDAVRQFFRSDRVSRHTRYEHTIKELQASFPPEDILLEFYERLFSLKTHSKIKNFLDLDLVQPDLMMRINESPKSKDIPQDLKKEIALEFKSTYEYALKMMGEEIFSLWPHASFAVGKI